MYRNGEYEQSLKYFESAYDTQNWSKSYQEIRRQWMSNYLPLLMLIIVAIVVAFSFANKFITKINKRATTSGKKKTFVEELAYGFHVIVHPFDGFWDLKHEKRGSVRASIVFIVAAILTFFYQAVGQGYLLNPQGNYSTIWAQVLGVLVPLLLFVVANWCLTTLFEGEGSFRDIFIAIGYSVLPIPLTMIPTTIASNFVLASETDILTLITTLGFIWAALLIFFGMMVTHDYSILKNLVTTLGTILGMALIMFLGVLFTSLVVDMVSFVTDIASEITYRL
jgi:hypothetical protein